MAAYFAAKKMAETFVGEVAEHPYSNYERYIEPITQEPVYHARGTDDYDLVIPVGILSAVLRNMPWILQHLVFTGADKTGSIFMEFSQKGPWADTNDNNFGNALVFEDVWPKQVENLEACERIDKYRPILEKVVKDAIDEAKKNNKKDDTSKDNPA